MTCGRQFGSISTRVPGSAASTPVARAVAIGSSTSPSVPRCRADGPAATITAAIVRAGGTLRRMDRRTNAPESLDGPLDDPAILAGNLRDLRRVNRWLGGIDVSARAIEALAAHRAEVTMLDVGTGGA